MTQPSLPDDQPDDIPVEIVDASQGPHPDAPVVVASRVAETGGEVSGLTDLIEQPAKVMRIGTMVKQLLEEVKAAPLDEASRSRLRDIHQTSIQELADGLAPELRDELSRLSLPFDENTTPTDAELRIAQAQLVGWLEGVFHGIQTALFAQQMAMRNQLEESQRRRALPGGDPAAGAQTGGPYL